MTRVRTFALVGLAGFVVQLGVLWTLTARGWPVPAATLVAVESAVLHNFFWHQRWTWRDRAGASIGARLSRFHAATGLTSIAVNVTLTWALVRFLALPPIAANAAAVAAASLVNFLLADRWVFRGAAAGCAACLLVAAPASAQPTARADTGWLQYLREVEPELQSTVSPCEPNREPEGSTVDVPDGAIHRWTGCTVVHQTTVGALVQRLLDSGTPPPQSDVVAARLLAREPDGVRVYLRLVRRTLISVTYDTEHEMRFERASPRLARSRSVATRIAQAGGSDHGFLWRLQSYWTYVQVGNDVHVTLVSLSLSRTVPWAVRPLAGPIATRVGRESVTRTLTALRTFLEPADGNERVTAAAP